MQTNAHSHTHLLTLILAPSSTAECLMTPGGGIGESSRYNMLDKIQALSIPPRLLKDNMYIHSRWVCLWSHKQQQKGIRHVAAHMSSCVFNQIYLR